jgi:hypothetical protein
MLVAQLLLFLRITKPGLGGGGRVRNRALPHTSTPYEYLGLEQLFALARLALHVVDGIAVFHVRVKAEDHDEIFSVLF